MITASTKSILEIASAFSTLHTSLDRTAQMAKDALKEALEHKVMVAGKDFEINEMKAAAADMYNEYTSLQTYTGGLEEQNKFLRDQLRRANRNLPIVVVNPERVARLITAMASGGKTSIADAVMDLLPDLSKMDAIALAESAVQNSVLVEVPPPSSTSPIALLQSSNSEEQAQDEDASGIRVIDATDDDPTIIMPRISTYPTSEAAVV